jgi:hypothetical protein
MCFGLSTQRCFIHLLGISDDLSVSLRKLYAAMQLHHLQEAIKIIGEADAGTYVQVGPKVKVQGLLLHEAAPLAVV